MKNNKTNFYEADLTFEITDILKMRISERVDLLIVLLKSMQIFILSDEKKIENKEYGKMKLLDNKKISRLIFSLRLSYECIENNLNDNIYQIVTIANPFTIKEEKNIKYLQLDLKNYEKDIYRFDYEILLYLILFLKKGWINKRIDNVENIKEDDYFELISFAAALEELFNLQKNDFTTISIRDEKLNTNIDSFQDLWKILRFLMMYELCYFRYDYDKEREAGEYHPLHHLDFNYNDKGTIKIGLSAINKNNWVEQVLYKLLESTNENETVCYLEYGL